MFAHRLDENIHTRVYIHWFLLSALSGSVNAGGFLAVGRFVTHVTGFATLFGVDLAKGELVGALGILSVPLFFLMGSMISACFIDVRIHQQQKPRYALVMALVGFCLILAALLGQFHVLGAFGGHNLLSDDYVLMALLCLASGLQNAAITTASSGTVRSSHMTGLTTDLGIGWVRSFQMRHDSDARRHIQRINRLRLGCIGSFVLGSAGGAFLFLRYNYMGFLLPTLLALYICFQNLERRRH